MSNSSDAAAITRREGRGSALLWVAVLGGPIAWAGQLLVNYSLEEWFACAPATTEEGLVLGATVTGFALAVTLALAILATVSGVVAVSCLRRIRTEAEDDTSQRARWMAVAGVMNSVLYLLLIVASFGPPLFLDVCRTTP